MLNTVLIILFYLIVPAIVLRLCAVNKFLNKIGAVLVCYVIGFIIGQTPIMPAYSHLLDIITTICIPLALPLLLFQMDMRSWGKIASNAIISMICAIVALSSSLIIGYFCFKNQIDEEWKIGGLLVGLYTGGTPNLASIQQALQVNRESYIAVHTIDVFLGAAYMLFMISIAHRVLSWILPAFKGKQGETTDITTASTTLSLKDWLKKPSYKSIAIALGISLIIALIGAALGFMIHVESYSMAVTILSITTLAILASFIPSVKKLKSSYDTGMYIILIFSLAVASMADLSKIVNISGALAGFIAIVMFGSMIIHLLLCIIFRIDVDTMMVTSAALICSPPFVPVVCGAIKNRQVMLSGITVGIIGYCIGNYLGVAVAYLLRAL